MLLDYELELTPAGGQLFDASTGVAEYGTRKYPIPAGQKNPAIGRPLYAYMKVVDANVNNVTNLIFDIVADDDGAGTNEVSLLSSAKTIVLANLTTAKGVRLIGKLDPSAVPAATNDWIVAKVTTTGTAATTGKISIWLSDSPGPVNDGVSIG